MYYCVYSVHMDEDTTEGGNGLKSISLQPFNLTLVFPHQLIYTIYTINYMPCTLLKVDT